VSELHLPWLEFAIVTALLGAVWVGRLRESEQAQRASVVFKSLVLLCTAGAWLDFIGLHTFEAHDRWNLLSDYLGSDALVIDELSAPLLPLAALLHLATAVATMRTKAKRYSFAGSLAAEAILLATLSCRDPWGIVALLAAGTILPFRELRSRGKPTRVYSLHIGLYVALLAGGQALLSLSEPASMPATVGAALLAAAVLIRSGVFPLHVWMTDLFEHATFGTALLFVTPMVGAYAAVRLVLPVAPDWMLQSIALLSLFTAVYAAGMALVQREARRFFCYLFLSHSSLVLVGLEIATPVGLTGALSLWLSVGLALSGFGLTLRSIEARTGRLSLAEYHGLYEHTPILASFFLLTGLASVGFPGTFGFVGMELLIEGVVGLYPLVGMAVVVAAALNGIAVVQAYFRVFTGTRHVASISLRSRLPERLAVLALAALILGGGLFPQPGISSRHHAATELLRSRQISRRALAPGLADDSPEPGASARRLMTHSRLTKHR
jgi:NADH-quinone oxidoreductase subunit M